MGWSCGCPPQHRLYGDDVVLTNFYGRCCFVRRVANAECVFAFWVVLYCDISVWCVYLCHVSFTILAVFRMLHISIYSVRYINLLCGAYRYRFLD